jgi:hypothetical protein
LIRLLALLAASTLLAATTAEGQKPQVAISLPQPGALATEPPSVRSSFLITDGATHDLLRNGFPARLHYRLERWTTGGWFDDIAAEAEWDVVVRYDALKKIFQVFRVAGGRTVSLGSFATIAEADAAVGAAFPAPIRAPRRGQRGYYNLVLDIEALSLTELDEVERWLKGDLTPAVRGKKNAGTAVGRGVKTVVVRLLGGERRRYEARTPTFRAN